MSHVIPIVSSSPPPLDDDDAGLEWNDEDDDFGHFTSAGHIETDPAFHIDVDSSRSDVSLPGDNLTIIKVETISSLNVNTNSSDSVSSVEDGSGNSTNITKSCLETNTFIVENIAQCPEKKVDTLTSENLAPVNENFQYCDGPSTENDSQGSIASEFAEKPTIEYDSSSVMTNNESVYSNTSTIDSGVFSTDLSPSTHPVSTLCHSSEYLDKPGALVQSLEEFNTADPSSDQINGSLQGGCSVNADSEDWSDFNAAFDNDSLIADSFNEDTQSTVTGEQNLETGKVYYEMIQSMQSVPLVNGVEPQEIKPISIEVLKEASSTVAGVQESGPNSPESELHTKSDPQKDDSEWGDFDCKVSDTFNEIDPKRNKDSPNNHFLQNSMSVEDNEGISQDNLDLHNVLKTEDSLLSANILQTTVGMAETNGENSIEYKVSDSVKEAHLVENADEDEFGTFRTAFDKKDSDSQEVDPVTFRTSVFETEEENTSNYIVVPRQTEIKDSTFQDQAEEEDFGNFNVAGHVEEPEPVEFADFGTADKSSDRNVLKDNESDDMKKIEDDNDWADFDEASPVQPTEPSYLSTENNFSRPLEADESKVHKLEKAIVSCFPVPSDPGDSASLDNLRDSSEGLEHKTSPSSAEEMTLTTLDTVVELGLSNPLEAKQQSWTVVQHPSKRDPKVRLWSHLKDVDSSHALQYGWSTSHCSQEVFITLHIDTQNVLFTQKKQAVPYFASGLSILEPIRGGADSKNSRHTMAPATLLGTSRLDQSQNITSVQDIPPVDFDWSSSGLTNPLTANTLDLDFLVVQGGDSYEKTSDEWDWVFKTDCQESTRPSLQPLEDILKKSTPTAKLATYEALSPEALRILDRMPDLSFMHSRVLMFPVKQ
ncbi:aftiphilin-like isoform X1 [Biomphalaria glabrata]|uniref:Aftiphilin-like isoform X1 n=1 Tax=Biomphalaria glabrata TaxID=6526 RepID=A0A9W2ZYI3_BIOGL|nr:aftiphilin-like isoform X1 [Biomphalaria glabrata]XP_055880035.1 aftiphilin-like isoform X1 [Biomphalaria glabrata]